MHVEDEAFWAINREGFNHDPGPRQETVGLMARTNRVGVEPLVNPPGLDGVLGRQSDIVETYEEKQMEARRKKRLRNSRAKLRADHRMRRW